jgi:hypothetical protein
VSLAENVTIKWEKNGYLVKKDTSPVHNKDEKSLKSNLIVDIVDESDFGGFRCIAENEVGTSYKDITLTKRGNKLFSCTIYLYYVLSRRHL